MEKVWLKSYPVGVPYEVDTNAYSSLVDVLARSCERFAGRPAFSSMGHTMTYAELDARSRDFAAFLQQGLRLEKGERIALMMPNLLQYPVALFGALRAGLVVVNCNPLYTARELKQQLEDSGAVAIVVLENFAHTVAEVRGATALRAVITTQIGDLFPRLSAALTNLVVKRVKRMVAPWHIEGSVPFPRALAEGRHLTLDAVALGPRDLAFLQYTGGTTGVPKGAMLTHGNLVANLQQASAWMGSTFAEGAEIIVTPLPLYHVFALTICLLLFLKWGALNVLIANPRDVPHLIDEISRFRFTVLSGVNTLFNALVNDPSFSRLDMTALKFGIAGGAQVQRPVAERWAALTGRNLIEGYGLTEASPLACGNRLDVKGFTGTIGLPMPSTEVSIRDEAGSELALGEIGEICVRGPQVTQGYWNRPDETKKVLSPDGWLRTGDLGFMDAQGTVKLIDRKKDLIVVSGFKVYPNEIEEVVMSHPGVIEAAAIGVPDARAGEVPMLIVVRRDPSLTAEQIIAHCRGQLTGYKIPHVVVFRDTPLPKSPIGKILRRLVREEVAAGAIYAPRPSPVHGGLSAPP